MGMVFRCDRCEICGSNEIDELVEYEKDGNTFYGYQCRSCLGEFNSESKLRVFNLKNKNSNAAEEKKTDASVEEKAKEDKTEQKSGNGGLNVFDMNRDSVYSLISVFGDQLQVGSGFIIEGGYLITNAHVIAKLTEDGKIDSISSMILCKAYKSNEKYELEFVYCDPKRDLAILKLDKENLKPVRFAKNPVRTGERIYAIGNSAGKGLCIIDGLVSNDSRVVGDNEFIVITANTLHGNSGGPLLNSDGELVGVVDAMSGDLGINYAIPLSALVEFLNKVKEEVFE